SRKAGRWSVRPKGRTAISGSGTQTRESARAKESSPSRARGASSETVFAGQARSDGKALAANARPAAAAFGAGSCAVLLEPCVQAPRQRFRRRRVKVRHQPGDLTAQDLVFLRD